MPLHEAIFLEPGVSGAKAGLAMLGMCREDVRLPLLPVSDVTKEALHMAMRNAGLIH